MKTFTSGVARIEIAPREEQSNRSFGGRLRPSPEDNSIPFSIDLPHYLPQTEPLTIEECGRWISEEEAAFMSHCLEMKRLELIRQYRDPSSAVVKIVPDRQRWLPWSIPYKRKEPSPGKLPKTIGIKEYKKAIRRYDIKHFAQLPVENRNEDHARRVYLDLLAKDAWSTGSSGCCPAEKSTIPTGGSISRVTDTNLTILHFDEMFLCTVIRPTNIAKAHALWASISKHFDIGFNWSKMKLNWKNKAVMPCLKVVSDNVYELEHLRDMYYAENVILETGFAGIAVYIKANFGEEKLSLFDAYVDDLFKHRETMFLSMTFPEEITRQWETARDFEAQKLRRFIKWSLPYGDFFQKFEDRKAQRLTLSQAVLEEHQKLKAKRAEIEIARLAPLAANADMVILPRAEFEAIMATNQKVNQLESTVNYLMERLNQILPPPPPPNP